MSLIPWLRRDREPTVDIFTPPPVLEPAEVAARRAFAAVDGYTLLGPLPHDCTPACPKYRNPASDYTGPILQGRRGEPVTPGRP
jgi:hypothetical protein